VHALVKTEVRRDGDRRKRADMARREGKRALVLNMKDLNHRDFPIGTAGNQALQTVTEPGKVSVGPIRTLPERFLSVHD
jgi:hypothetical protein